MSLRKNRFSYILVQFHFIVKCVVRIKISILILIFIIYPLSEWVHEHLTRVSYLLSDFV